MHFMPVDLHSHSTVSDGSYAPRVLARLFAVHDVTVAALTDHDTIGGHSEFLTACDKAGIVGIGGIEFSTVLSDGVEAHILGYGLPDNDPRWTAFLKRHAEYLRGRCERTLKLLEKFGYKINIDDVYRISRGNPPMPPHILKALAEMGIISSFADAVNFFIEYLGTDAKAWVPHETLSETPIAILREVGAIPIVSHPNRYPGIDRLEELLAMGARGFELYYPNQTGQVFEKLKAIAEKHNCLVTGGCDFHGAFAERKIREVEVPMEAAEKLFEAMGKDLRSINALKECKS